MKTYQCITKCHVDGKKWKVGELLETNGTPCHHFVLVSGKPELEVPFKTESMVSVQLKAPRDPMRPNGGKNGAVSFSQMQEGSSPLKTGMAAGLEDSKPITSPKELRKNKA